MARGCHWLIRNGARLVETAEDIHDELAPLLEHMAAMQDADPGDDTAGASQTGLADEQKQLLDIMGHDPLSLDELSGLSGLTIDQLSSMLLILELEGRVEKLSGGRYSALHRSGQE